jgi:hypothetical protein
MGLLLNGSSTRPALLLFIKSDGSIKNLQRSYPGSLINPF